jgi:hypothetical protein
MKDTECYRRSDFGNRIITAKIGAYLLLRERVRQLQCGQPGPFAGGCLLLFLPLVRRGGICRNTGRLLKKVPPFLHVKLAFLRTEAHGHAVVSTAICSFTPHYVPKVYSTHVITITAKEMMSKSFLENRLVTTSIYTN